MAAFIQTTFAAISFAGAGYLFKMFDKNGYEKEMKRHNRPLEKLTSEKEKFYELEVRKHDRIQELRQKLCDANADLNAADKALDELRKIQSTAKLLEYRQPQLSDFCKPSDEMKEYQHLTTGIIGASAGYLLLNFFSCLKEIII